MFQYIGDTLTYFPQHQKKKYTDQLDLHLFTLQDISKIHTIHLTRNYTESSPCIFECMGSLVSVMSVYTKYISGLVQYWE